MGKERVLVVEDHDDIIEILEFHLKQAGFEVDIAKDGVEGTRKATGKPPNLLLLDLMLPGMSGFDVCLTLKNRKETREIPIIMLTAKGEESDIVKGLELGADDYVTKPFGAKELLARVKAVLRRRKATVSETSSTIQVGDVEIDTDRHQVMISGKKINLTQSEFGILKGLASKPGRVFTRDQLLEKVRGPDLVVVDRNIDVHVASLRKKLKPESNIIETVRGVGYRFRDA